MRYLVLQCLANFPLGSSPSRLYLLVLRQGKKWIVSHTFSRSPSPSRDRAQLYCLPTSMFLHFRMFFYGNIILIAPIARLRPWISIQWHVSLISNSDRVLCRSHALQLFFFFLLKWKQWQSSDRQSMGFHIRFLD